MTLKNRLAKLEALSAATAKRAAARIHSTPDTRAQAVAELDVWRREMVGAGLPGVVYGPNGVEPNDTDALLATMHQHTLQRMASIEHWQTFKAS